MIEEIEFKKIVGDAIRKLRTSKKYSTEKLAELSNTDYSSVNQIENYKQNPKSYTLYKILRALDVDLMQLIAEKTQNRNNIETAVIEKIRMLDDTDLHTLHAFLEQFKIIKK